MGKKSKAKTKKKKDAKKAAAKMGKKLGIKDATKIVNSADRQGLDVAALASSVVSSIPIVGGLASGLIDQGPALLGGNVGAGVPSGRGGVRGVTLVDSKLGNLGVISRKKALSILVNRGRRPPRRSSKTVAILKAGESIQVVK